MQTTKITDSSQPFYENIFRLYHSSFPAKERRAWAEMDLIMNTDERFNMLIFTIDNEFCGFLSYWNFESFVYVEHFAVAETKRDQGLGKQIMKSFAAKQKSPIILEVELPQNSESIRRIAFYEALDFTVISKTYLQPPYDRKSDFLPLILMTNNHYFGHKNFDRIRKTLYEEVYQQEN